MLELQHISVQCVLKRSLKRLPKGNKMNRFLCFLCVLLLAMLAMPALSMADNITYTVDQAIGSSYVAGTITTDGTIGILSTANIVGWNLSMTGTETGSFSSTYPLTPGRNPVTVDGNYLTADSTGLFFNFSSPTFGEFYFDNSAYPILQIVNWSTGQILAGNETETLPQLISSTTVAMSGNQMIASAPVVATPEPGTAGLMLFGVAALLALRKLAG